MEAALSDDISVSVAETSDSELSSIPQEEYLPLNPLVDSEPKQAIAPTSNKGNSKRFASELHPDLQSQSVKRRVYAQRNSLGIRKPKDVVRKHLSAKPKYEIENKDSLHAQIEEFFRSPCPVTYYGRLDNGTNLMGASLEYNLRKLVGAPVEGDYCNLISWADTPNHIFNCAVNEFVKNDTWYVVF
jgi:hypothetical protein